MNRVETIQVSDTAQSLGYAHDMRFDDPVLREAYRQGARDAFEYALVRLPAPEARALEQWLTDLDAWDDGDPAPPPQAWGA